MVTLPHWGSTLLYRATPRACFDSAYNGVWGDTNPHIPFLHQLLTWRTMNRFIYILILSLCSLAVSAQTDGYDPTNPPLPNFPEEETKDTLYTLTVNSSPYGSGSLNTSGGEYMAGATVTLRAYNNGSLYFMFWIDDEGQTISTSAYFQYVMPKRDAVVTAVYRYDPGNPTLPEMPEEPVQTYNLTLKAKPEGAGSFNFNSTTLEENASVHLYAYNNTYFYFRHWENAKGEVVSTAQNFYYTMPAADTQLFAVYDYNPTNPGNPARNFYDSFTGEVIIDDFTPGDLSSAVYEVTNGNTSNITSIVVAGAISNYDFSIANNYSTCNIVDLSRTNGATYVPSYCYSGNTNLNRLSLPASISRIEYSAFNGATGLTELTCYAAVPPTLEGYVFDGVMKGLVVYVPSSSVALYEQADGWKDYEADGTIVIMPIQNQVVSLEVSLPEECADGRYKNMPLELLNVKSGQRFKYVVTDRVNYIFNNLVKGTRYVATLKNLSGAVLAKSDTISLDESNVSYTFDLNRMKQLRNVKATVLQPDGTDVSSDCKVVWYDADGRFLLQDPVLAAQVSETNVRCGVTLPQTLAMEYVCPADTLYEVVEADNLLTITLAALPKMQIVGNVVDVTTHQAVKNANITVSQMLNGKYAKAFTAKTDNKGAYSIAAFAAPTTITWAATDYVSQTLQLADSQLRADTCRMEEAQLKPITGATITTDFTYTASVAAGVEPAVQNYYSDYSNVSFSIYNATTQQEIKQFNVQNPNIVLLEEVSEGDSLQITAKSKTGAFMDVTVGGRIDAALRMSVTVPIVQLGGIDALFTTTENSKVLGILYDSRGVLVGKYNYSSSLLSIRELKDGDYTLVTMGASDFFGSIYNLEKFSEAGLQQNIDYLVNTVTVKSGVVSPVKNVLVPFFDESKFYYTGENTSFTVNKTSIVAGNYLTLTAKVDFKEVYRSSVSGVSISVELPEGTNFVDGSVMVGTDVAFYELNGRTLTIPLDNNISSDRVRFCVVPTVSGEYSPNASVSFLLGDKQMSQPIGSTQYTVKDVAISVPAEINIPELTVSGVATGRADIVVYANNEVIGTTKALANGYWAVNAELKKAYNMDDFEIYAKITTTNGVEMLTPTKSCIYNRDHVAVKTVEMSFYNGWLHKNISVLFDLEHATVSETSYMFYTATDITFAAELSNNNPEVVDEVVIRVYTNKNEWHNLKATYSEKLNKWIASKRFESNNLPVGVKVGIATKKYSKIDKAYLEDWLTTFNETQTEAEELKGKLETIESEVAAMLEECERVDGELSGLLQQMDGDLSSEEIETLVDQFLATANVSATADASDLDDLSYEELLANGERLLNREKYDAEAIEQLLAEAKEALNAESILDWSCYFKAGSDTIQFVDAYGVKRVLGRMLRSEVDFSAFEGLETITLKTTDAANDIVVYYSDEMVLIDNPLDEYIVQIVCPEVRDFAQQIRRISKEDVIEALHDACSMLVQLKNAFFEKIDKLVEPIKKEIADMEAAIARRSAAIDDLLAKSAAKGILAKDMGRQIAALDKQINSIGDFLKKEALMEQRNKLVAERKALLEEIKVIAKDKKTLESALKESKGSLKLKLALLGEVLSWYDLGNQIGTVISYGYASISDMVKWSKFIDSILPCKDDEPNALALKSLSESNRLDIGLKYLKVFGISTVSSCINGFMTFNPAAKGARFLVKSLVGVLTDFLMNISEKMYKEAQSKSYNSLNQRRKDKRALNCNKDKDDDDDDDDNDDDPPYPTVDPIHDPSGYVYEGVSSNRLQGVTATCYYKEIVEDMYGDLHEEIVLWDAEEYGQKNPLFTDENGMYQWDVPQGLWQVRFEKEGYVSTQSEWIPVPPPQMDVNIAMVQNAQPEVSKARAYEDGVEVEFSKYMNMETLNAENLYLKVVNGEQELLVTDAAISMLNQEAAIEGSTVEYASKVKLATARLGYYDEAYLVVSTGVQSYAGIPMAQTFEQKLDVEKKVREILVDEAFNVEYNGQKEITIAAVPAEAAVGKKLTIVSASEMIAATDVQEVTFDADGQATFTVSGELYGSTALNYTLQDADLTASSVINVVDPSKLEAVKLPVASRISGTAVYRGQTVALSCETEGAVIYYTTDGSCPCDETKRVKYERPIAINDAMTLKFMAIGTNFDESDVQECTYSIRQSDVKLSLAKGWNWSSHDVASPVAVSELAGIASQVLTQTANAIDDPLLGLIGSLTTVDGSETMKIEAKEATEKAFIGEQYNPTLSPITLHEGWNWLGYPIALTMTLADALSYIDADEGDCISSLDGGFATFTDGAWAGTLETMNPGAGYLYKSVADKSFIYNNVPTVLNAKAIYGHRLPDSSVPWSVDKHRYPNLMPVIAQVCYSDGTAAESTYYVAAFAGEECRGVGKYADGMLYLSVYGDEQTMLTFKAWNPETASELSFSETLTFVPDVVGSNAAPFRFLLDGMPTGINAPMGMDGADGIYSLQGIRKQRVTEAGVYIIRTTEADGSSSVRKVIVNK